VKIGFIGLGIMGKPMAKNLVKAGHALKVFDVMASPVEELAALGAEKASSAEEAAKGVDLVITMLPNSPHVAEAVLGEKGALRGMEAGGTLIDMSSIAPSAAREIGKALAEKRVRMLDAPVSGGEPKAIEGTLAVMVGGDEAVFEEFREVLLEMGSSAVLCGGLGAGNVTKLANQVIVASNIAAMSEAFTLAAKAGVDPEKVFDAIKGGLAGSAVLNAKAPMVLAGNYKPGFRIELHVKDLRNALDEAGKSGAPLPLTETTLGMLEALESEGKGAQDHSGLIQYYEKKAGIAVRSGRGGKP
jgi:2-hydroxy-3-oxopropionate reductase